MNKTLDKALYKGESFVTRQFVDLIWEPSDVDLEMVLAPAKLVESDLVPIEGRSLVSVGKMVDDDCYWGDFQLTGDRRIVVAESGEDAIANGYSDVVGVLLYHQNVLAGFVKSNLLTESDFRSKYSGIPVVIGVPPSPFKQISGWWHYMRDRREAIAKVNTERRLEELKPKITDEFLALLNEAAIAVQDHEDLEEDCELWSFVHILESLNQQEAIAYESDEVSVAYERT